MQKHWPRRLSKSDPMYQLQMKSSSILTNIQRLIKKKEIVEIKYKKIISFSEDGKIIEGYSRKNLSIIYASITKTQHQNENQELNTIKRKHEGLTIIINKLKHLRETLYQAKMKKHQNTSSPPNWNWNTHSKQNTKSIIQPKIERERQRSTSHHPHRSL